MDDLENEGLGIYEHSTQQCELLNGTLATPDDEELLLWLAKRMFQMGVDRSYIGLKKLQSDWVWMKKNGTQATSDLHWRNGFPEDEVEHSQAVITVETIEVDDENNENAFIYYNYNFYIENGKTYNWYGFNPVSNIFDPSKPKNGYYYICHYADKPSSSLIQTTTIAANNQTSEDKTDRCYCSSDVRIQLSDLEDSYRFSSPDYPNNYCSDSNCRWIFSTAKDLVFKLEWIVFSTENEFDTVSVIDGGERNDPLITKCSGVRCPDEQSSGNEIQIHFSADHVTTDIGFKGQVTVISPGKCYCSESTTINFDNIEDSHIFKSPDHPSPYCIDQFCSWIFTGPEGTGLSLTFDIFELQNSDFFHIYDDSDLVRSCTGNDCPPFISWSESVRIEFISDHLKSMHKGFAAVVKSVPNRCEKDKLNVPLGRVNYTRERTDGNIAIGGSATVTCEPNSKMEGTVESITATSYCTEHSWTQLAICVPVCAFEEIEKPVDGESAYVCKFQDVTDFKLVEAGHHITRSEYEDLRRVTTDADNRRLVPDSSITLTCTSESTWHPETPQCHSTKGVLLLGGGAKSKYLKKATPEYKGVELYSPIETKSTLLDTNLTARSHHASLLLGGVKLLMAGGYKKGEERPNSHVQPGSRTTDIIDLQTFQAVRGPPMLVGRLSPAAAVLDGTPVICGGYKPGPDKTGPFSKEHTFYEEHVGQTVYSDCEALLKGTWTNITHMPIARSGFVLVAYDDCLFAIGGDTTDIDDKIVLTNQVHKYCPKVSEDWTEMAAMANYRTNFAAAIFEDLIMVCGSQDQVGIRKPIGSGSGKDTCEKYNPITDEWQGYDASAPELKMKEWRHGFSMVSLNGRFYAFGGAPFSLLDPERKTVDYFEGLHGDYYNQYGWKEVLVQPREGYARFELVEPRSYSSSAVVPLVESWHGRY